MKEIETAAVQLMDALHIMAERLAPWIEKIDKHARVAEEIMQVVPGVTWTRSERKARILAILCREYGKEAEDEDDRNV